LALALVQGWFGPAREFNEFCECLGPGLIKQQANTWSNLGFVAVGLLVGLWSDRDWRSPPAASNPMTTTRLYPALYALVVALIGPGSMALHASNSWLGGKVDVLSMYLWACYPVAYRLSRRQGDSPRLFLSIYLGLCATMAVVLFLPLDQYYPFGALLLTIAGLEVHAVRRGPWRSNPRWLLTALGLFVVAFSIWLPSRTGGPLCDPDSLLQGHALWHLLCAGSAGAIYLYLRSESAAA
jgi:hypothetical protein